MFQVRRPQVELRRLEAGEVVGRQAEVAAGGILGRGVQKVDYMYLRMKHTLFRLGEDRGGGVSAALLLGTSGPSPQTSRPSWRCRPG